MEENEKTVEELVNSFPEVYSRRPYDDDENPNDCYLESDDEYVSNNHDAVIWFLENAVAIQKALTLLATQ